MATIKSILLTVLVSFSLISDKADGLAVGDMAADFSLKNVNGKMVSLGTDGAAKGYILVFTCNTCPYANMYEERIIDLHNKYAAQGYSVLAIQPNDTDKSPGDSFENMQARSKEKAYPFPYLIDETQEVTKAYGATNTPQVYVLKKVSDNNFRVEYIGAIDNNSRNASAASKHYVQEAVDNLIAGSEISTKSTKAIGCTIKWGN